MDRRKIANEAFFMVCDDVRHEVGNKTSIMGIYQDIIVGTAPTILPKIHLVMILRGVKHQIKTFNISLISPEKEVINFPDLQMSPDIKFRPNHHLDVCVAPLKIKKPGKFIWEIMVNGEKKPTFIHEMEVKVKSIQDPSAKK